jgi:PAS domain-containing protein
MNAKAFNLSTVFQSLPAALLVMDPDMIIVAATDNFYKLTLNKKGELIGKYIFDVFPENSLTAKAGGEKKIKASFEHVIKYKTAHTIPVQRYDLKLPAENSVKFTNRWWRITNSPVLGANGELAYIINAVEDITSIIDELEEAQTAIKLKQLRS